MMIRFLCLAALLASATSSAFAQTATYSCQALGGSNCPGRILDAPQIPALASQITLPPEAGSLCAGAAGAHVAVNLRALHGWIGDLQADVSAPAGSASLISNLSGAGVGGCQGADIDATFRDDGVAATCNGLIPAVGGDVAPLTPLAGLIANPAQIPGPWTMTLRDTANNNDGALLDWSVTLTCDQATAYEYLPVPATSPWQQLALLASTAVLALIALQRRRRVDRHGR